MKKRTAKKKPKTKISLFGISPEEALKALLSIPATPKNQKKAKRK